MRLAWGFKALGSQHTAARSMSTASLGATDEAVAEPTDAKTFLLSTAKRSLENALEGTVSASGESRLRWLCGVNFSQCYSSTS